MTILLVAEAAFAGVGRHVLDLAEGLAQRGHTIDIAYGAGRVDDAFRCRCPQVGARALIPMDIGPSPSARDVCQMANLRRHLRQSGPFDIVHGHASKGGAYARWIGHHLGSKVVYTPNAFITQSSDLRPSVRWMYSRAERTMSHRTEALICVSPQEAEHARTIGLHPRTSVVIPNGITFPALRSRSQLREELGIAHDAIVIGFVGRLAQQKGVDLLLDSFARLDRSAVRAELILVGDGEERAKLETQSKTLGIDDRIRWLGTRDGQQTMPAFDLLAMPSHYEGFPYVLLEALWARIPAVVTTGCNAEQLLGDGAAGRIVERTIDAFAAALDALLSNRVLISEMSAETRRKVAPFSVDAMVDTTERLFTELVSVSQVQRRADLTSMTAGYGITGRVDNGSDARGDEP